MPPYFLLYLKNIHNMIIIYYSIRGYWIARCLERKTKLAPGIIELNLPKLNLPKSCTTQVPFTLPQGDTLLNPEQGTGLLEERPTLVSKETYTSVKRDVLQAKLGPEIKHALIATLRHTAVWYFIFLTTTILFFPTTLLRGLLYCCSPTTLLLNAMLRHTFV